MASSDNPVRFISLGPDDFLVEAMVAERNNDGAFHAIAFKVSAIDYVVNVSEKISAIVLKNGTAIPVALSFESLKQALYAPDFKAGPSIDLTALTGKAVKEAQAPRLTETVRSKCGTTITLHFNAATQKGPFGTGVANLDMPIQTLTRLLAEAKERRQEELDLCRLFRDNPNKYGLNPT